LGIKYTKWGVWNDGIDATIVTGNANQAIITQSLILKMLKVI
jgi:hypothetical protein